jgi:hypothetical protein
MIDYLLNNPEAIQTVEVGVAIAAGLLLLVSTLIIVKS